VINVLSEKELYQNISFSVFYIIISFFSYQLSNILLIREKLLEIPVRGLF